MLFEGRLVFSMNFPSLQASIHVTQSALVAPVTLYGGWEKGKNPINIDNMESIG